MEDLKKGLSNEKINPKPVDKTPPKAKPTEEPTKAQETYEKLHEGQIVDWDESVDKKDKKHSTWDESLEAEEDEMVTRGKAH